MFWIEFISIFVELNIKIILSINIIININNKKIVIRIIVIFIDKENISFDANEVT